MSEWRRSSMLGKRDASEPAILDVFRKAGATVVQVSGKDVCDLFVGWLGVWHAVEVKTGKGKLRPGQELWARTCQGEPPSVARTAQDALDLLSRWQTARAIEIAREDRLRSFNDESGGGSWAALEDTQRDCRCDGCHCGGKDEEAPA